jgi:hypothetical protein
MRRTLLGLSFLAFSCTTNHALPGGEGTPTTTDPTLANGLPCDVDAVLAQRCRSCHGATPLYGAPMPLVTHADVSRAAERIGARIHDEAKRMPPPPNDPLGAADMAAIDAWIAAGAPRSDAACTPGSPAAPPIAQPLSCTPDVHMKPAAPWAMPVDKDDLYVCYGFDMNVAQKRHLTAIAPLIDNPAIVHHLVLFESPRAVSPTPQPCSEASTTQMRIVAGWAPGGKNLELPPEAGFAQEGTMHYVVQVHYNNVQHKASQMDASGFDFCTTDKLRPNDADALVFGTIDIDIPAHGSLDLTCDYRVGPQLANAHVFASMPHMHQIGSSIATSLHPSSSAGAAPIDLGTRSAWNFENQPYERVDATLRSGDVVRTRCAWKNPSGQNVEFGPNTDDEMCFSFMMYYPKITSQSWSWMLPAVQSTCRPTN